MVVGSGSDATIFIDANISLNTILGSGEQAAS